MAARLASASDLRARFGELPLPRRWALALGILWVVVVVAYAIGFLGVAAETRGRGTVFLDGLFLLMALVLPLILLWLAAWLAEELARQREVIAALADASRPLIDALETTQVAIGAAGGLHRAASGGDSDISQASPPCARGRSGSNAGWRPSPPGWPFPTATRRPRSPRTGGSAIR